MSKENVKLFYEALAKDKALQEKSMAIGKKYEGQKLDEKRTQELYQKELVPLAKEAGYNFTLAELQTYAEETQKPAMREVSEEELAAVAGGAVCVCVVAGWGELSGGGQDECTCFAYGFGNYNGKAVCGCVAGGGGSS